MSKFEDFSLDSATFSPHESAYTTISKELATEAYDVFRKMSDFQTDKVALKVGEIDGWSEIFKAGRFPKCSDTLRGEHEHNCDDLTTLYVCYWKVHIVCGNCYGYYEKLTRPDNARLDKKKPVHCPLCPKPPPVGLRVLASAYLGIEPSYLYTFIVSNGYRFGRSFITKLLKQKKERNDVEIPMFLIDFILNPPSQSESPPSQKVLLQEASLGGFKTRKRRNKKRKRKTRIRR
jgi:hypothetical protein